MLIYNALTYALSYTQKVPEYMYYSVNSQVLLDASKLGADAAVQHAPYVVGLEGHELPEAQRTWQPEAADPHTL